MLNKQTFLQQLSTLIEFETLTGNFENNARALDYVTTLVHKQAKIKRFRNKNAEILLLANSDTLTPEIGYLVHSDVVSTAKELFKLQKSGNKIFGRGVSDMKFSIPLGIALLNELIERNSPLSFCLAITTDEEIGGFAGGAYLAEKLKWRPKVLLVPDGGDNLCFVKASKGVAQFEIISQGKAAHASRPWQGKNALLPLCRLVVELEREYGKNSLKENWKTTLNFGQLQGGLSTNQVCDEAKVRLDYRYPETDSRERIELELRQKMRAIEPTLRLNTLSTGLPTFTDTSLSIVKLFLAVFEEEFRQPISVKPNYGASDARHFAAFKIPILMIKPKGGDIHCASEWLDLDSTLRFYQALRAFI